MNWELLKHPLNWVTVFLMVWTAALAWHLVASHYVSLNRQA